MIVIDCEMSEFLIKKIKLFFLNQKVKRIEWNEGSILFGKMIVNMENPIWTRRAQWVFNFTLFGSDYCR